MCLTLGGCFADTSSFDSPVTLEAVQVLDEGGAPWPAEACPRRPVFTLRVAGQGPHPPTPWLVRDPRAEHLEDLRDDRPRAATRARLEALTVVPARPGVLALRPARALRPRERYVLAWRQPTGDLFTYTVRASPSPAAGAGIVASLPAPDALHVAPDLGAVFLQLDGFVQHPRAHLEPAAQLTVTSTPCAAYGLPEGTCLWVRLAHPLAPDTPHTLTLEGWQDATDAPLPAFTLTFRTGVQRAPAPRLEPPACEPDERRHPFGCLRAEDRALTLRGAVVPPALVTLRSGARSAGASAARGAFELRLADLRPDATLPLQLEVRAPAHGPRHFAATAQTLHELATVSVRAVRADPLGEEPAQEYVELLNFGTSPISLMGFSLTIAGKTRSFTPTADPWLSPGVPALLVGPGFDPEGGPDAAVPAGVPLLAVGQALRLPNRGARLALRDEGGRWLSGAPALATEPGRCLVRVSPDPRSDRPAAFAVQDCNPGAP